MADGDARSSDIQAGGRWRAVAMPGRGERAGRGGARWLQKFSPSPRTLISDGRDPAASLLLAHTGVGVRARRVGTPRANAHGSRWSDDVEAAEGSVHDLEAAVDASFPQPLAVGDVLGANTSRLPTPLQPVAIPPGLQFAQGLRASSQRRCRIPCPGTSASRIGAGVAPHPSVPPDRVVPGRSAIGEHQVATALKDRGTSPRSRQAMRGRRRGRHPRWSRRWRCASDLRRRDTPSGVGFRPRNNLGGLRDD